MQYFERIDKLTKHVPVELIDFSSPRDPARAPTQASSNFITNREQGDWAEKLLARAINDESKNLVAVKYGKSDDLVAGENGFDEFFEEFQNELDTIGKRPDLLIFRKSDFNGDFGFDISNLPCEMINDYVKKAIAGLEVRSSAFLIDKYDKVMLAKVSRYSIMAMETKQKILNDYFDLLSQPSRRNYVDLLEGINEKTLGLVDFKVPGWRSSARLIELNNLFKILKHSVKEIQKRDYLSITPKVEDIKVVHKWVETFNVPHYYFQVFFDKIYGISYEKIIEIISNSDNEGVIYSIESDTKNQNKTTIKINSKVGREVASKIDEPTHKSARKELDRGRLLFYVTFDGGTAYLDVGGLTSVLGLDESEF
ncbi:AccI family restriction endonuclease [Candidatus Saccharibacteria bacterium]|nr:AccI family restriction endonuclease [Candidatus Saccharibacteria bacterium]